MKKIWNILIGASLLSLLLLLPACNDSNGENTRIEQGRVEKVFMHTGTHFSFLVEQGTNSYVLRDFYLRRQRARFIVDVRPEDSMWVKIKMNRMGMAEEMEIHLRSLSEVNGSGWQGTKGRAGSTTVIE
ncbi:MAG: hypothetical protein WC250_01705 [Candidatus Paceibacterota bacterium]|jgi:hypothetical protein